MIDRETALELAKKWFESRTAETPHMAFAAVDQGKVIEASFAWILPWNDRRALAGDSRYQICGHSPLVILKSDGTAMYLPKLTGAEKAKWGSKLMWGNMEHRIANLAEKLGIKNQ